MPPRSAWPALPVDAWRTTRDTLHLWTQVVGKIRLEKAPLINHWWQVPLYLSPRGLTTSTIPDGKETFEIELDLLDHRAFVRTSGGVDHSFRLEPMTVAAFYRKMMDTLAQAGVAVEIYTTPSEIPDPIPFENDEIHASYDPEWATKFWRVLTATDRVFTRFRSGFIGKASPVHFFWGSFDHAVTRFSGRRAPDHPGAEGVPDRITREAYSHEVSSAEFWPGGEGSDAIYYSYAYPEPAGFSDARVHPEGAFWSKDLGEFVLPYDVVQSADDPESTLMSFLISTYEAAASHAGWDREALERPA
ncbi:MAG: hypothetical protein KY459_10250 [Acidobacteria bacterium]|nr:hypothetical protein [Acidobacteriota bacterium]